MRFHAGRQVGQFTSYFSSYLTSYSSSKIAAYGLYIMFMLENTALVNDICFFLNPFLKVVLVSVDEGGFRCQTVHFKRHVQQNQDYTYQYLLGIRGWHLKNKATQCLYSTFSSSSFSSCLVIKTTGNSHKNTAAYSMYLWHLFAYEKVFCSVMFIQSYIKQYHISQSNLFHHIASVVLKKIRM